MMDQDRIHRTRIENRWPVAREGIPFIFIGLAFAMLFWFLHMAVLFALVMTATLFTAWFFRDPERHPDADGNAVLSPADGKIIEIRKMHSTQSPLDGPAVRISIFMNIFNVHVNRISLSGTITKQSYHSGKFLSANLDKASEENENNRLELETDEGCKVLIVQIAGLVARRIVCWVKAGDPVRAGQRFGLIRFGSRLDVYVPSRSRVTVQRKDRVKAGETILAYLPPIE